MAPPGKEEVEIKESVLFGKYRLERVLGNGGTATVYLATHLGLQEVRAIKRISKASEGYRQFRKEGLILKSIRHPGIPIVYDLEEDEDYGYLIEEYLEGENLFEMVKEQGPLSTARTVSIGIQICHLVHHLHSAKTNPILYLDLQPKNLLLCHDTVKLVDFGLAAFPGEEGGAAGTPGFAAPEQYAGELPDERTDIYGIGAVLYFLCEGESPRQDGTSAGLRRIRQRRLRRIIRKCLERRREKRYPSASQLETDLKRVCALPAGITGGKQGGEPFPIVVAFAGNRPGVGTTHLAVGLTAYLRDQGFLALYAEQNRSGAVRELLRNSRKSLDRFGSAAVFGLSVRPFLGENVRLDERSWQVIVKDLGVWSREADAKGKQDWDVLVEVRGGKPWNSPLGACPSPGVVVWNFSLKSGAGRREFVCAPYFPDPFFPAGRARRFYARLSGRCGIERGGVSGRGLEGARQLVRRAGR